LEIHVIPAKLPIAGASGNRKNKLTWVPQEWWPTHCDFLIELQW